MTKIVLKKSEILDIIIWNSNSIISIFLFGTFIACNYIFLLTILTTNYAQIEFKNKLNVQNTIFLIIQNFKIAYSFINLNFEWNCCIELLIKLCF